MKEFLAAFVAGVIFAVGLGLGQMTRPEKIIGFLDFFGQWDPTLAFVLAGAVVTYGIGYRFVVRRERPLLVRSFNVPSRREIDKDLVLGSLVFGIGWGIAGYCPGPALVSLASGYVQPLIFTVAMIAGIKVHTLSERQPDKKSS